MAGTCINNENKLMNCDTVSITVQTLNVYESYKNEINNSVVFSQNSCSDYSLLSWVGRQKLVCKIIMEQEALGREDFFFLEQNISTFGMDIDNKHLRIEQQIGGVLWIPFGKGKKTKQFEEACISKSLRAWNRSCNSAGSIKIPKLRSVTA
jgi:hypothetical protein